MVEGKTKFHNGARSNERAYTRHRRDRMKKLVPFILPLEGQTSNSVGRIDMKIYPGEA